MGGAREILYPFTVKLFALHWWKGCQDGAGWQEKQFHLSEQEHRHDGSKADGRRVESQLQGIHLLRQHLAAQAHHARIADRACQGRCPG